MDFFAVLTGVFFIATLRAVVIPRAVVLFTAFAAFGWRSMSDDYIRRREKKRLFFDFGHFGHFGHLSNMYTMMIHVGGNSVINNRRF
jgi:hypothetical protein